MDVKTADLSETFAVLSPSMNLALKKFSPTFYQELDRDFDGFKHHVLISMHSFTGDWGEWEIHPHGDEMVILVEGAAVFVLRTRDGDRELALQSCGEYVVVPKNHWHTARIDNHAKLIFITPGEGTDNQAQPSA